MTWIVDAEARLKARCERRDGKRRPCMPVHGRGYVAIQRAVLRRGEDACRRREAARGAKGDA